MLYIVMAPIALLAGFINGVSGFGAGIVIMSVLPYFLDVVSAAAVSNCVGLAVIAMMCWRYRKYINTRYLLLPAIFFVAGGAISIAFSTSIDKRMMKIIFGIFLIILALYFVIFSSKVKLQANLPTMFLCGFLSGICDGLFGVGGPLMVLFFLALTASKEEYLGTVQAFFCIVNSCNFLIRIFKGIFTFDLVGPAAVGIVFILFGLTIGNKVVDRMDGEAMKKLTYGLIGISSVITLISTL